MKKIIKIVVFFILVSLCVPIIAKAEKYSSLNLKETLNKEKIEANLGDYKETNEQITIYMFRGERCGHCQNFLKFLNNNVKEYGKYFKLVSFEVWKKEENASLMQKVASRFNLNIKGVPFIVIGEKTYQGYNSKNDKEILETIVNYYNNKGTYKDVVAPFLEEKKESKANIGVVFAIIVASLSGIAFLIYMAKEDKTRYTEKKLKSLKDKGEKETVKEEKKKETKVTIESNRKKKESMEKEEKPSLPKLKEINKAPSEKKTTSTKNNQKITAKDLPKKKTATTKEATKPKMPAKKTSTKSQTKKEEGQESNQTKAPKKTTKK